MLIKAPIVFALSILSALVLAGFMPTPIEQGPTIYVPLVSRAVEPAPPPEPEPAPPPTLQDGDYQVLFRNGDGGWIRFRVAGGGTQVESPDFLIDYENPACYPVYWSWEGTRPIENGKFYYGAARDLTMLATLDCTATSSTTAHCRAHKFIYGGGALFGACGIRDGDVVLIDD